MSIGLKRCVCHEPARKKPGPLIKFRPREYLHRRAVHVQKSLDKLFGVEKINAVGRA